MMTEKSAIEWALIFIRKSSGVQGRRCPLPIRKDLIKARMLSREARKAGPLCGCGRKGGREFDCFFEQGGTVSNGKRRSLIKIIANFERNSF